MRRLNPAAACLSGALDDTENRRLASAASAFDGALAAILVHVLRQSANERLVRLYLAAHFEKRASFHCQSNAMVHEPSGFLSDAERPVHLVAADSVLAISNHPDRRKPLAEVNRAVFKDGADLGRKLPARMLLFALPHAARGNEPNVSATARWAVHATGPAQLNHRAQGYIRIGEIPDGFDEGFRLRERCVGLHETEYGTPRLLSQVCYYPP